MIPFGKVQPGSTLDVPFETFALSTGANVTMSDFAVGDIKVYKDGGTTERASTSGFTLLDTDGVDFDGVTGVHGFSIDLSDNTTADFYKSGSRYLVVVSTVTVDGQTVSFLAATFRIGEEGSHLDTFIATLSSQTSFTLNSGPAEDDALNGQWCVIHDAASAVQQAVAVVLDYVGASRTVTLAAAPTFTIAAKDNVSFLGPAPLQPITAGQQLSVDSGGRAKANTEQVEGADATDALALAAVAALVAQGYSDTRAGYLDSLPEVHGLLGRHVGLRAATYDADHNLTAYDLCVYDTAGHATTNDGVTGLLHRYSAVNVYNADGDLLTSVTTRVS